MKNVGYNMLDSVRGIVRDNALDNVVGKVRFNVWDNVLDDTWVNCLFPLRGVIEEKYEKRAG